MHRSASARLHDSLSDRCTNQLDMIYTHVLSTQEGTAKYVESTATMSVTLGRKFRHKESRDQHKAVSSTRTGHVTDRTDDCAVQAMIGTVPYLGLYLSDLTYIDSAYPNTIPIENSGEPSSDASLNLINFEKHRKEFETLAQIKLFQSAANAYTTLHPLARFKLWFDNVRTYTDAER